MNREPLWLYLFRVFVGIGILVFMTMLYWSSALLEKDMKALSSEVNQLRAAFFDIQSNLHRQPAREVHQDKDSSKQSTKNRPHIDPNLPNLLEQDPFYAYTLPKMLGPEFKPQGVLNNDVLMRPENLHPFSNWAQVNLWNSLCTVSAARQKFGIYETFAPNMALKVEERTDPNTQEKEYWIHLQNNVYWQPLQQAFFPESIHLADHFLHRHLVTAYDYKFYFDALMNPGVQDAGAVALRNYLGDIKEIRVLDDLTFVVKWNSIEIKLPDGKTERRIKYIAKLWTGALRPLPRFVYQYFPDGTKIVTDDQDPETYRTNSIWAQNFSQHWAKNIIVSCGPWIFDGMTENQIRFRRNPDHFDPLDALAKGIEYRFKSTLDAMWQGFKANLLDSYPILPTQLLELESFLKSPIYEEQRKKGAAIHRLEYLGNQYSYIGWNEAKPFFKSKFVRRALTMSINRQRIIEQNLNGLGVELCCPFSVSSPSYDRMIIPWPYDVEQAKRLLAMEGWYDRNGDGVLDNDINGKLVPFEFSLTYYIHNPTSKAICEYISTALKEIGIICNLNGVDIADLSAAYSDKSFDAVYGIWGLGTPPEEIKQLWHSSGAKEKGSSNTVGFANAEVDAIADALEYEFDPDVRRRLYHKFDAIIHDEAPYTFLFMPRIVLLYREYLQNVFVPAERQDLIPGANVPEPDSSIFWKRM